MDLDQYRADVTKDHLQAEQQAEFWIARREQLRGAKTLIDTIVADRDKGLPVAGAVEAMLSGLAPKPPV